jgi:hypothetical protein
LPASPTALKTPPFLRRFRGWAGRFLPIFLVFELLGSSGPLMPGILQQRINVAVTPWHWDLVGWEVAALVEKLETQFTLSLDEISPQQQPLLVKEYLGRAQLIGRRNAEILQLLSQGADQTSDDVAALQSEVDDLRSKNEAIRRQVVSRSTACPFHPSSSPLPAHPRNWWYRRATASPPSSGR